MRKTRAAAIGILTSLFIGFPAAAEVKVVTTIKPVHSLVAAVMKGAGSPSLLIKDGGSPHSYSLRPSQAREMQQADVVFWIGPTLETFLDKALATLATKARIVPLIDAPGVTLLTYAGHEHEHEHKHEHEAEAAAAEGLEQESAHANELHETTEENDPHIWMDPRNAKQMVNLIEQTLAGADPANAALYNRNARDMAERLEQLNADIAEALTPVRTRRFIVYHQAFQYMERRYRLNGVGAVTVNPEVKPGAEHISDMRKKMTDEDVVCVFAEPQFRPAIISAIIEGTTARSGMIDPIGSDVAAGPDQYIDMMRKNAETIRDCLRGRS